MNNLIIQFLLLLCFASLSNERRFLADNQDVTNQTTEIKKVECNPSSHNNCDKGYYCVKLEDGYYCQLIILYSSKEQMDSSSGEAVNEMSNTLLNP